MREKQKIHHIASLWAVGTLLICAMTFSVAANAAPWILEQADTPDLVSQEQLDDLEGKARAGDYQLKKEFAAAYLYETRYPHIYGCKRLKYGHRCRAMATRPEVGTIFLKEILDTPVTPTSVIQVSSFQKHYADSLKLAPFDPKSNVCQEAIHYYELAIENGQYCVALRLKRMAEMGICMEKSEERAMEYWRRIPSDTGCPRD